jgi:hypothetical protein
MTTTVKKKLKPTLEEVLDTFYRRISRIVKRARDDVSAYEGKGRKCGEIANLMKCDIFKFINWELTTAERESINISGYERIVDPPLSRELPNEEHGRAYDEVAESFIQNTRCPYTPSIEAGIVSNYRDVLRTNESIYTDNIQRVEEFLDAQIATVQNRLDGGASVVNVMARISDIQTDIETDIDVMKSKLTDKKKKIEALEFEIDVFKSLMHDRPLPPKGDPDEDGFKESTTGKDVLAVIGDSLASLATPFIFLAGKISEGGKGFFEWVGEHLRSFYAFIKKTAFQPAFWVAILFAFVNTPLFHRLFSYMFSDRSMVYMFTAMFVSNFAILPFSASKHLYDLNENQGSLVTKVRLAFDVTLALVATAYPIMVMQNKHIYAEEARVQIFAAFAIGLLPFLTSTVIGFMNYNRLKTLGAIAGAQNDTTVNETEAQEHETGTQPTKAEPLPENETDDNSGEKLIMEGHHHE